MSTGRAQGRSGHAVIPGPLVFNLDSTMREKAKIAIAFAMAEDGTVQ